jgi:hypothetical protein
VTTNVVLLLALVALLFISLIALRRHQRLHCNHLHKMSDAVIALAVLVESHHLGELPKDVSEFIKWYFDEDNADEFAEDDKAVA